MDTIQMLGYEKLETLYENRRTFVCRAQNKGGETYLLKAIKDDQPTLEQLARFEYEYKLLSELDITGIKRVRELVKHYEGHVMLMEDAGDIPLIDATIFRSIRHGDRKLSMDKLQWILEIFIEMAQILDRLHDSNLIHRDINSANFSLLPDSNRVNILDFGLAIKLDYSGNEMHYDPEIEGALSYIAPEQTGRVDRTVDYRTDFYSLGISMYELITGQKPFTTDDPLEMVHCHIAVMPAPPHGVNQNIPEMVSAIIMKLMEKAPEHRYQSAAGIVHDLGKCLEMLCTTGVVEHFEIGMNDVSSKFQFPKKLYGRESEKEKLEQVYAQVVDGAARILLVGGYSGVGKTSIIQEICRPAAEFGGFFAGGKAEQFQRNTPYFVFAQAAKELVGTLLQQPDSLLEQWKERLLGALNDNGRLIIDMVPELTVVIGSQSQVNELGPAEHRNRFLYTFGNFFKTFARKNHPLTLFLDDLQWCDQPSMELVKYLLSRDDIENLLVVCSYRDNELVESHPLYGLLDELQKSDKTEVLTVKPLEEEHIVRMLADMLHHAEDRASPLAEIIYKKTRGNPFFVKKLLFYLHDGHYIHFNGISQQWEWDAKKIESIGVSDNIVDFMISQILKLTPKTQEMLKLAALVGSSFDLMILSAVANIPVPEVVVRMREAVEGEIILPDNGDYAMAKLSQMVENLSFRFAHDRVQQACAALMDREQQKKLHLLIGRVIKMNTPKDEWMDYAMDIVCHLNEGFGGIETDEERWETARFNLWACHKAKASSAFFPALQYISCGVRILPENAWAKDYGFTFEITKVYVECAYLNNDYALADEHAQHLLRQVKTPMEQAEIRLMQSRLSNFLGQLDKVIQFASLGLQLLKVNVPTTPGMHLLIKEMIIVKAGLVGKSKENLLNLPPMKSEKMKLVLQFWNEINRAAYLFGNTNLFLLSILKQMQLTLRFGNSREAGLTYVSYSMILAILGDFQGTYEFCELARRSSEKEGSFECLPTILFSSGFFGHAWNRSWQDIEQWFEKSMEEAVKYGDHHTIALAGPFMYAFKPDASISLLVKKAIKQFPVVKQTNNRLAFNFSFLMIHRWLNYAGLTDGRFTMSISHETYKKNGGIGIVFSEEECLDALHEGNFLSALGVYYQEKKYIHYLYDDYAGAMRYLKESDNYIKYHTGTPYLVECKMCDFLVLVANIPDMPKKEAEKAKLRLKKEYNHVKSWAKHCPVNFEHLQYIIEAELARLAHKPYKAADLYDRAIQTARQNGFMRDEALANELAAKMFIEQRKEKQSAFYMAEALKIYRLWGADAKVSHMAEKYGNLLKMSEYPGAALEMAATTENLDLMSIVAASNAVLKEVHLPNLLRQIMKTVMENSGAQKACILLKSEQGWTIEAERLPGAEETEVLQSIPLEEGDGLLPSSVINFCIHMGEHVLLGDAANTGQFCKDPYIQQNQTRSLLCMPILNQGNQEGILYLENNLSADVFTKERVHILQLMAAQFSISIKNVRLFADLLVKTEEVHQSAEEVLRSDIAFLQAQIKPHFLYNAINTISAFTLDDSQMARDLLAKLSQYLRESFDFKNRDKLVTLHKELELVEAYLFIEKARFGDRLRVVYDIEESVDCLLPPLVIQPLVENSVQHGLSGRKKGGTVEIAVRDEKDFVIITVEDDGVGIDEAHYKKLLEDHAGEGGGVALKNIHRRLIGIYGHGLEIERKVAGGTRAIIKILK